MYKIFLLCILSLSCFVYADEKTDACNSVVDVYKKSIELQKSGVSINVSLTAATQLYSGSESGYDVVLYVIRKGYYDAIHHKNFNKELRKLKKACLEEWFKESDHDSSHDPKAIYYMS